VKAITALLVILLCGLYQSVLAALSAVERESANSLTLELRSLDQLRDNGNKYKERIRTFSDEDRRLVIELAREGIENWRRTNPKDWMAACQSGLREMAMLGDDWAIVECTNWFLEYGTRAAPNTMRAINSPKVIPLIGEALFKAERLERSADLLLAPTQETVAEVVVYTLSNSSAFDEEVISWARRVDHRYTMKMIRDWYRENEAKLKAGDFKAVRPGTELPKGKHTSSVEIQPTTLPITAPPPDSATKVSATLATTDSSGVGIYWILVPVLAVFVGSIWLLARKSK
jgi:hypothetical protein